MHSVGQHSHFDRLSVKHIRPTVVRELIYLFVCLFISCLLALELNIVLALSEPQAKMTWWWSVSAQWRPCPWVLSSVLKWRLLLHWQAGNTPTSSEMLSDRAIRNDLQIEAIVLWPYTMYKHFIGFQNERPENVPDLFVTWCNPRCIILFNIGYHLCDDFNHVRPKEQLWGCVDFLLTCCHATRICTTSAWVRRVISLFAQILVGGKSHTGVG